jgi:hypothetical protein
MMLSLPYPLLQENLSFSVVGMVGKNITEAGQTGLTRRKNESKTAGAARQRGIFLHSLLSVPVRTGITGMTNHLTFFPL